MEGVEELSPDMIENDFSEDMVDMRIKDLKGHSYRWCQRICIEWAYHIGLSHTIVPKESNLKISKKRVVLRLKKTNKNEHWSQLAPEPQRSSTHKKDSEEGSAAGLMELMRTMYMDGDDNMKRAIAEAMTKAQSGETPDLPNM